MTTPLDVAGSPSLRGGRSEGRPADAVRVALSTAPDAEAAERIARALVQERLAACVNLVGGVRSIYRWQGAVEDAAEVLLVIKTCAERVATLTDRLRALHPYELPELVVLPAAGGLPAYLDWVIAETAP
jgi:periplasmic divalent cation tolerance protein